MTTEHVLVDNINSEDTVPTLLQELMAFGERAGAKVTFHQDADELVFLWDGWEGYGYHLWEKDGVWHFDESHRDRQPNYKRSTRLSTPDFDIAARWLIYRVGSTARTKLRMHPLEIPVEGGIDPEDIAPGWHYEIKEDRTGHLFSPRNQLLPATLSYSRALVPIYAVTLSHLMGFTPEQLLASYQDPYGRPYLTRYLHESTHLTHRGKALPNPIPPLEHA